MIIPPPGSHEADEHGCTCPGMDNNYGRGAFELDGKPIYWINDGCPLHAPGIPSSPYSEMGDGHAPRSPR